MQYDMGESDLKAPVTSLGHFPISRDNYNLLHYLNTMHKKPQLLSLSLFVLAPRTFLRLNWTLHRERVTSSFASTPSFDFRLIKSQQS